MRQPKVGDYVLPANLLLEPGYERCLGHWKKGIKSPIPITKIIGQEVHIQNCEVGFTTLRDFNIHLKIVDTLKTKLLKVVRDEET